MMGLRGAERNLHAEVNAVGRITLREDIRTAAARSVRSRGLTLGKSPRKGELQDFRRVTTALPASSALRPAPAIPRLPKSLLSERQGRSNIRRVTCSNFSRLNPKPHENTGHLI